MLAHQQAGVGGRRGIYLALHQRRKVQQTGDDDGHISFAQTGLVQQHQQVLPRAAGQAIHAYFLALQVRRLADVAAFERHHVEHVLWVDVINRAQLFTLLQRGEKRARVGESRVGLAGQQVAYGITTTGTGHIVQVQPARFIEALVFIHQQVGHFGNGLAPTGHSEFV